MLQAFNPVDALARDKRRVRAALWLLNLTVAAFLGVLAVLSLGSSHDVYAERAREATENIAIGLQASIGAQLAQVDMGLRQLRDEIRRNGSHAQVQAMLAGQRALLPFIEEVGIASSQGSVSVIDGRTLPVGADLSTQAVFRAVRDARSDDAVLSEPLQLGAAGRWVVVMARRLTGADGRFDGMLYALIPAGHFERVLGSIDVGNQGAATLRSETMRLVARHSAVPSATAVVGSAKISSQLTEALVHDPARGFYVATTAIDGVERTNAYRRLQDFPLWVVVGLGTREFYAPWRAQAAYVAGFVAALVVVVGLASLVGYRSWVRARCSVRARMEEGERSRALLRTASDGIHVLDRTAGSSS